VVQRYLDTVEGEMTQDNHATKGQNGLSTRRVARELPPTMPWCTGPAVN